MSVFSGHQITIDKQAKHYGNLENKEVHNQYGFYHGMSVYQGLLERNNNNNRPFILSRSFFAGTQRYDLNIKKIDTRQFGQEIT
jgi:mannosyl-oligosaccharide alpha-1,3-glucosidase